MVGQSKRSVKVTIATEAGRMGNTYSCAGRVSGDANHDEQLPFNIKRRKVESETGYGHLQQHGLSIIWVLSIHLNGRTLILPLRARAVC